MFRDGLALLLEQQKDLLLVGHAVDGEEALKQSHATEPDVVLMDVAMPVMNGIEATRQIKAALPDIGVLCLSIHTHPEFVLAAMEAGANGYVAKDCSFEELVRAVEVVSAGQVYLSPSVAHLVVTAYNHAAGGEVVQPLSRREIEVLRYIADGLSIKEIAERLFLSEKTVGTHRRNIMDKLEIGSVAGLTKYAIRRGLTSTDD